jgi:hypothetical protein
MATTWSARWRFSDGVETYNFQVNPNQADSPFKDVAVEPLMTTDNVTLLVQGTKAPRVMTFSGFLYDPTQYDAFLAWLRKRRRVYLYDHFDRQMEVVVTSYQPRPRKTTLSHPWAHDYTISVIILKEPDSL